jgi:hypothetical protein
MDLRNARWRKSTRSGGQQGGACVEVADNLAGIVAIRDSKDPQGPALVVTPRAFAAFTEEIRARH